jgi:Flp pilus assembly protein TadD
MTQARSASEVVRLLDLSRHAEAESVTRSLLASDPESARLHRLLALALIGLDRPREAVEAARTACRIAPEDADCLIAFSRAAVALGDLQLGLVTAERAVANAPHAWVTHFTLGRALLATGSAGWALAAADEAVRLSPSSSQAHNLRGMCLARTGRRAEARTTYRRALTLDPHNALAMNNLAAMDALRNPLRAVRGLTSAASTAPHERIIHRNLAIVTHNLLFHLRWVVLGGGLVEIAFAYGGAPRWVRTAGLALIAILVLGIVVRFVRALPRGARRSPHVLLASLHGRTALALLYLAFVGLLVVQEALGPPATRDAATGWLLQLLVVGAVVMTVQRFRHQGRRRPDSRDRGPSSS